MPFCANNKKHIRHKHVQRRRRRRQGTGHRHSDTEEYTPGRGQAGSGGYGTRIRQTTPAAAGGVRGTLSRYIVQENQSPPAASSSG
ncbi:hypothetical protein VTO73DRAFT_6669 [Trametes versicolor]